MEIKYLSINWKCFAKSKEFSYYLIVIGRLLPDMSNKVPQDFITKILAEEAVKRIERAKDFGGQVCEDEVESLSKLSEMTTLSNNPRILFIVKFKTFNELILYRKEMF